MLDFKIETIDQRTDKPETILGEEQSQALEMMKAFLKNKDSQVFSLIGAAGTGKSFLMRTLIDYMRNEGIQRCLCAPTHKAKLVLERFTDDEAITLHKLLSLSPNLEILDLDFNDLKFVTKNSVLNIPHNGVVICDESSMIMMIYLIYYWKKLRSFAAKLYLLAIELNYVQLIHLRLRKYLMLRTDLLLLRYTDNLKITH